MHAETCNIFLFDFEPGQRESHQVVINPTSKKYSTGHGGHPDHEGRSHDGATRRRRLVGSVGSVDARHGFCVRVRSQKGAVRRTAAARRWPNSAERTPIVELRRYTRPSPSVNEYHRRCEYTLPGDVWDPGPCLRVHYRQLKPLTSTSGDNIISATHLHL